MSLRQGTAGFPRLEIPHESFPSAALASFGCLASVALKMWPRVFLFSLVLTEVWGLGRQTCHNRDTKSWSNVFSPCEVIKYRQMLPREAVGSLSLEVLKIQLNMMIWAEIGSGDLLKSFPVWVVLWILVSYKGDRPSSWHKRTLTSKGHKESKQLLISNLGKLKSESQGKSFCVRYKITSRDLSLPPTISQYSHSFGWSELSVGGGRRGRSLLEVYLLEEDKLCCHYVICQNKIILKLMS